MAEFDLIEIDKLEPYKVVPFAKFRFMFVISYEDAPLLMFPFFSYDSAERTCRLMNVAYREGIWNSWAYKKLESHEIGEVV